MSIDNAGRVCVANRGNNKILLFNAKGEYITAVHNGELLIFRNLDKYHLTHKEISLSVTWEISVFS